MLGPLSKLPFCTHARLSRSYLVGRRTFDSCFPSRVTLLRREWRFPVQKCRGLSCTAGRNFNGCGEAFNGAGRYLSNRAAMIGNGKKMETPSIPSFIEIRELAKLLRMKPKEVFKSLGGYQEKKMHRIVLSGVPYAFPKLGNIIVPFEDVQNLARRLNKDVRFLDVEKKPNRAALALPVVDSWEDVGGEGVGRRPVVVLLGHFNHGKTTILDALLGPDSGIAEREAGGITQEIRARTVSLETSDDHSAETGDASGKIPAPEYAKVATFLDTPGQEIFYRMRTNGARVADAIVLVVSAEDGVCLQTSESIGCAEELGLPVVVVLNKIDLLGEKDAAKRLADLSEEVREFIALERAQVLPISAHTGYGLDKLRAALVSTLGRESGSSAGSPTIENDLTQNKGLEEKEDQTPVDKDSLAFGSGDRGSERTGVSVVEAPEGAATGTVLDYVSSAKTGKMLLVLVDRGVLRPGDFFALGAMWGSVRSLYDEEGSSPLQHAGPGVAAKAVVVSRTSVLQAPLGEPFRVLTEEAAEKVATVRSLGQTIGNFIDLRRMESDFPHLLEGPANGDRQEDGAIEGSSVVVTLDTAKGMESSRVETESPKRLTRLQSDDEEEDMPVSIVVKADSANTLASILDALDDWGEIDEAEDGPHESKDHVERPLADQGHLEHPRRPLGESDLQHRPRQRLVVSVAHSGVGAVTSSDVRLARDCECPVFAHSVTADASASRELKTVGGGIVKALPEGAVYEREILGVGGQEGFIGRAGEGRECVVISETVGELLGEIERFVLRVR